MWVNVESYVNKTAKIAQGDIYFIYQSALVLASRNISYVFLVFNKLCKINPMPQMNVLIYHDKKPIKIMKYIHDYIFET